MTWGARMLLVVATVVAVGVTALSQRATPKFYPDDPLRVDPDTMDVPKRPATIELSDLFDRFSHIFGELGAKERGEARNINTLDDVPDSSWFTNRHAARRMSIAELVRGPDRGTGPDPATTWTVVGSKSEGLTPGFQIVDQQKGRYFIKLDPLDVPDLASAAEVIGTKLFYAFGYNTPENYIVAMRPEHLEIRPGTIVENQFGEKAPLTPARLENLLRRVPRRPDGSIRVIASKFVAGLPIGPFRYDGTRSDDPNDIVPHEDRRELRGLRLLAAWLNHDDTRNQNTLDAWVEEDGRHYVRHYLIDFGSTFGSGSVEIQLANLSFQYWLDLGLVKRNALGLGLHVPPYRGVSWPDLDEFGAVGRWESEAYQPQDWRNDYPNPAFARMTDRDAFWAAKIIMAFTPEELRAIVETGQFARPELTEYFWKVLVERQKKSARYYMRRLNPIDAFTVEGGSLRWANLADRYGFADGPSQYRVRWFSFDNLSRAQAALGEARDTPEPVAALPPDAMPEGSRLLRAEIATINDRHPEWNDPVAVYIRREPSGALAVVGVEREK